MLSGIFGVFFPASSASRMVQCLDEPLAYVSFLSVFVFFVLINSFLTLAFLFALLERHPLWRLVTSAGLCRTRPFLEFVR